MENQLGTHWSDHVDLYCERLSPAFWAEPLNAVSNIFFFIAAYFAFRLLKKEAVKGGDFLFLAIMMAVVGTGSFIFHTIATRLAGLADVLPIAIFIHFGFGVFLYRTVKMGFFRSMLGVLLFGVYGAILQKLIPNSFLNHSVQYFPAVTLLLGMTLYAALKKLPVTKYFFISFASFVISLTFRSFDMTICPYFPLGVHFMWHTLNAIVMYYVYKAILMSAKKA